MSSKKVPIRDAENMKNVLRHEIGAFMKSNDLSQYDVARICNLPSPYINQILSSKTKSVSFAKLCDVANKIGLKLCLVIERN